MNEQKGFVVELLELVGQHLSQHKRKTGDGAEQGRLRRLLRWLTPNGGTLLLVAVLIATAQVWAKPLVTTTNAPGPSATTVNYQGRLADSGGTPITQTDVTLQFAIYDALVDGGLIWPATGTETHIVDVVDGLFSVGLGSATAGGIPTSVWNGDRYLEITVGTQVLSPRELIRSVPIAGMALTVPDESITAEKIAAGAISNVSIIRQNDGVSNQADRVILTGWGYISGNDASKVEEPVNFGITFSEPPIVLTTYLGSGPTPPTSIADPSADQLGNNGGKLWVVAPSSISETGFQAIIGRNIGTFVTGSFYAYSWIAIGTVSN